MKFKTLLVMMVAALSVACGGGGGSIAGVVGGTAPASITGVVGGTSTAPTVAGAALTVTGAITVNGKPGTAADIQPGSIVRVAVSSVSTTASSITTTPQATGSVSLATGGRVTASSADVRIEIEGAITAVDTAAASLTVLGQTVFVDALTEIVASNPDRTFATLTLADLAINDYIEASGTRRPDNSLLATRIEREQRQPGDADFANVELRGTVAALDTAAQTFTIGATTVNYLGATVTGTLANGVRVEVEGAIVGSTLNADQVQVQPVTEPAGNRIDLDGPISATNTATRRFDLLNFHVDYATATVVGTIADGARADVQGTVDTTDTTLIHATRVEIGHRDGGSGRADGEVKGAVTGIDTTLLTLNVSINLFFLDAGTIVEGNDAPVAFNTITVGTPVEVKFDSTRVQGSRQYATKIEITDPTAGEPFEVKGTVTAFDGAARTLTVNGYSVTVDSATTYFDGRRSFTVDEFFGTSRLNRVVEVRGPATGINVVASRIQLE